MPGIFISYRRIDTSGWAGHLFAELKKSFGASQVFMDVRSDIPLGTDFQQALVTALEGCDALLALIGPRWLDCARSDGTRRLNVPDDWVRSEIATALRRKIKVIPILLGGASFPDEAELPEDLRALPKKQRAEVTDRWDYDIGELIKNLIEHTPLRPLDDVSSAKTGIRLLKDLMTQRAVAEAVSHPKEVIENTYAQLGELVLFKVIHDSLHTIEAECLRPIQAGGPAGRLRRFKMGFAGEASRIKEAIQGKGLSDDLREDLIDRLDATSAALETAVDAPSEAAYNSAVGELSGLLSGMSPQLEVEIGKAAERLNLDGLLELMGSVRDTLPAASAGKDPELESFVQGIDALSRLREELTRRVSEHRTLQRLDSKLRTVCRGRTLPGMLAKEWGRILRERSRLAPPFSPELAAVNEDLVEIECEIEGSFRKDKEAATLDLVTEYFRVVSSVFRNVDGGLKEFCLRLSAVAQPLQTVLSMF